MPPFYFQVYSNFDLLKRPIVSILVIVFYILMILIGVSGNTMVVVTVIAHPRMYSATNIFIANLAMADIFICLLDLPISLYYQLTDRWVFGALMCHLLPPLLGIVVYTSTMTLMLIAVDRYLQIVCPMKTRISTRLAIVAVVIVTIISFLMMSPMAVYSSYVVIDDVALGLHLQFCTEAWPSRRIRVLYSFISVISTYVVPLMVIVFLYYRIFRRVRLRRRCRRTKTTKMLVAVVAVFTIAWTPWHIFALMAEVNYSIVKGRYFKLIDVLLRGIAMSSSCANPLLYGWFNENYRNAFLSMLDKNRPQINIRREESITENLHGNSIPQYTESVFAMQPMNKQLKKSEIIHYNDRPEHSRTNFLIIGTYPCHTESTIKLVPTDDQEDVELMPLNPITSSVQRSPW